MAYFLDEELNALTKGSARDIVRSAPSTKGSTSRRPNRFPKPCHKCGTYVKAQAGYLDKVAGAWVVYCPDCP